VETALTGSRVLAKGGEKSVAVKNEPGNLHRPSLSREL